ncbi:MAG: c-type cytochrome [Spongiibacteraceae bacterium]
MEKNFIVSSTLAFLVFLGLATASAVTYATEQAVIDRYAKSCSICHTSGVGGAPKTGDTAAWAPRLDKGMDALVGSVEKGLNAMPPKGMCFDCSADDYKALIEHMSAGK